MSGGLLQSIRLYDGATVRLEYHETLASTSALAKQYANKGYPDRYAVFAERQMTSSLTGTRLSEGESERGMFLSVILRPAFFPSQAGLLGPLSTVALISALEAHTSKNLGIGWISNIFCEGRHIGGVSVEGKLDSFSSYEYMIVSFAIKLDEKNFPPRLSDMVRKVFESENVSVSMLIAKTVLNKFFKAYASIRNPEKFMDIYKRKFLLVGKRISLLRDGKRHKCRVVDVDKTTCSLTVEEKGGIKTVITSPSSVIIPKRIKIE